MKFIIKNIYKQILIKNSIIKSHYETAKYDLKSWQNK